jgi:hypothetical protein
MRCEKLPGAPPRPQRASTLDDADAVSSTAAHYDAVPPDNDAGSRLCEPTLLQTLVCYRLIDPGSEWRLHRQWFEQSAMADLLGEDYAPVAKNALYRCLDKLLPDKAALFSHLRARWQDLFAATFEVLLYDLTSTYFESPTALTDPAWPMTRLPIWSSMRSSFSRSPSSMRSTGMPVQRDTTCATWFAVTASSEKTLAAPGT